MSAAETLAAEIVADAGWLPAIAETLDAILCAGTWRERRNGLTLLLAIIRT